MHFVSRYIIYVSDHIYAVDAIKQSKTFEQRWMTAYSKSRKAVEGAIINSNFAAKKDMASCLVSELNDLCIDQV